MKLQTSLLSIPLLSASSLFAQIALDDASNYTTWGDSDNQGSGFLSWSLNENTDGSTFAGHFLGDSTAGAGNINTAGDSILNFNIGSGGSVSSDNATLNAGVGAGYKSLYC